MLQIATISWNNLKFTQDFVNSLKFVDERYSLYIWDNGSTDGTLDWLREFDKDVENNYEKFPKMMSFYYNHSESNVGQCIPWNWSLSFFEQIDHDIIYLCNNDIRFTSTINRLPKFIRENTQYGMICPAMLPRTTPLDNLEEEAERYCDNNKDKLDIGGLEGPLMAIPKHAFEEIGFYDEQFQFSFEDMDYHQRAHKAGFKTAVYHNSCVWHFGGASTKNKEIGSIEKGTNIYYERFQKKHG